MRRKVRMEVKQERELAHRECFADRRKFAEQTHREEAERIRDDLSKMEWNKKCLYSMCNFEGINLSLGRNS